ncbi:MAG: hypothetical protein U5J97_04250 [Trueperaceae bacterium]|nr:hypothetical protein [Trueperaceae bacterium]
MSMAAVISSRAVRAEPSGLEGVEPVRQEDEAALVVDPLDGLLGVDSRRDALAQEQTDDLPTRRRDLLSYDDL